MQKFYNPKLYKPPPKRELSEEERITLNMGGTLAPTNPPGGIAGTGISFVQIRAHARDDNADQAPPPPPPAAPGPYKKKGEESGGVLAMMDMLAADLDKETLEAEMEEKDALGTELQATKQYLADLHKECDWLLGNFETRKEARASEIDAMGKAKAVLNGADYSLVQTGERRMLRGEKH